MLKIFFLYIAGINLITFFVYALDKRAAIKSQNRIPEKRLHQLEWLGGTPAAFLAQRLLRHKTRKGTYQLQFWAILLVQIVLIVYALLKYRNLI